MNILAINAGSSSIKYKAYCHSAHGLQLLLSGLIEGIGEKTGAWLHTFKECQRNELVFTNHKDAFAALAKRLHSDLKDYPLDRIGHRVVHGGTQFYQPTVITKDILLQIKALSFLAPIHNPVNILGIELAQEYFSKAIHVAIFDTGFHHTMPDFIYNYPIDLNVADKLQIKRYGFHGINHEYVCRTAAHFLKKPLENCQFISLHLGNGASACLVKNGRSYDTSMGMTPLAGLVMGTRCGDIDPAIPLYLLEKGMDGKSIDQLLNKNSGLKGVTGDNDMRNLIGRWHNDDAKAKLAIAMYVYAIQKTIGAYMTQLSNLDAILFTGGVGENASLIRALVLEPLTHLNLHLEEMKNLNPTADPCQRLNSKGIDILLVKGDEERMISEKTADI